MLIIRWFVAKREVLKLLIALLSPHSYTGYVFLAIHKSVNTFPLSFMNVSVCL